MHVDRLVPVRRPGRAGVHARPRGHRRTEQPRLHNIVEGLSIAAGIPKPRVYVVPGAALNAFATGRDPEHASIAVTEGLLDALNRVELEGVIGHELAHVVDRDILVGTVVATLAGAGDPAVGVLHAVVVVGRVPRAPRRRPRRRGGRASLFAVGFVLLILAPIFAQVIRFSVSRQREYLADAQGALLTRYPPGLASALRKIGAASGDPDALGEQRDGAPVAATSPRALEGERIGAAREAVQHPPADRGPDPPARGDVTSVGARQELVAEVFETAPGPASRLLHPRPERRGRLPQPVPPRPPGGLPPMARSHRRRAPVTRRGKTVAALATVTLVVGGAFAYFTMFPEQAPAFVRSTLRDGRARGGGAADPDVPAHRARRSGARPAAARARDQGGERARRRGPRRR